MQPVLDVAASSAAAVPLLELRAIRKSFQLGPVPLEVLKGVDFAMQPRELTSIVGSSGCGKSTLMNIIGFLDTPSAGEYRFEGQDASSLTDKQLSSIRNRKIGFVFQQFHLLPKLTALQNVCLPLVYRGASEKERKERAVARLERVGMAERMEHKPAELSGGQQQRVAIARALCGDPSLILADEPTGALDTVVGQGVMDLFLELNAEGVAILIITHDPSIAGQCTRSVRMKDGVIFAA